MIDANMYVWNWWWLGFWRVWRNEWELGSECDFIVRSIQWYYKDLLRWHEVSFLLESKCVFLGLVGSYHSLSLSLQDRWRNKHETDMSVADMSYRRDNVRLVGRFMAKELLQFRVWSLQHFLEDNRSQRSSWLPCGKLRSFCYWWLDLAWSHDTRVHKS